MTHPEEHIAIYYGMLERWNAKMNLMRLSGGEEEFRERHVRDAVECVKYVKERAGIIDIGTGPGVPGILIKIVRPDVDVTLIDANRKRIRFCDEVIRRLGLRGVRAVWTRAEDWIEEHEERFDYVISRATWDIGSLGELGLRFLKDDEQARIIGFQGRGWEEEREGREEEIEKIGLEIEGEHLYRVFEEKVRYIIVMGRKCFT